MVPSILIIVADTLGWRSLLLARGRDVPPRALVLHHLASEAIARSMPLGVPVADSVRSLLLKREYRVPMAVGVVSSVSRRLSLGITQFVFVLTAIVLGYSDIARLFSHYTIHEVVGYCVIGAVVIVLLVLAGILFVLHQTREVVGSCFAFLDRFPLTCAIGNRVRSLLSAVSVHRSHILAALAYFFVLWMMEFIETYILLNALGFGVTIQQALSIEAGVSLMRLAAFFLPAGVGIQETGYASIIAAMGLETTSGVGLFLITKRVRDIFWIALGYAILLAKGLVPSRKRITLELTKA